MKKYIAFLIFCLPSVALSSTTGVTTIKEIMLDQYNGMNVYFSVAQSLPATDGCRANVDWPFVVDISTEFGKNLYSAILASYVSKSKVRVFGFGTCNVHTAVETVKRIEFK